MNTWSRFAAVLLLIAASAVAACSERPRFGWDFEQEQILDDLGWRCRAWYRLSTLHATSGTRSLEIVCHPAHDGSTDNFPGLSLPPFDPDWTGYRALAFDLYNPERVPLRLTLRAADRKSPIFSDCANRTLYLPPGQSRVSIPFDTLVTSGTKRMLDVRKIRMVALYFDNPTERHTFYLDRVRLD